MVDSTLKFITNPQEKSRVKMAIYLISFALLAGIILSQVLFSFLPVKQFNSLQKSLGSFAVAGIGFCFAVYPLFWLIRQKLHLKFKLITDIAKRVRAWHIPAAIASIGLVFLHAVASIHKFTWNGRFISGGLALLAFMLLAASGPYKYKNRKLKIHLLLVIALIILVLIHAKFAKLLG